MLCCTVIKHASAVVERLQDSDSSVRRTAERRLGELSPAMLATVLIPVALTGELDIVNIGSLAYAGMDSHVH